LQSRITVWVRVTLVVIGMTVIFEGHLHSQRQAEGRFDPPPGVFSKPTCIAGFGSRLDDTLLAGPINWRV
jgi:hypothetical protein